MEKLSKPLATSLAILVILAGLAVGFNSITAKEKPPGYWEATLPGNYHAKEQLWFFYFPDFEAKKLHFSTVMGPPEDPTSLTAVFDVDYVKTTGSALGPWAEDPWLDLYAEALRLRLGPSDASSVWVEVAADKATLDIDFHDPDPYGVIGTLIGHLTGSVKVYVNPGLPVPPPVPAYENSKFTFKWTFVEPNYSVELDTYDLVLPIGEPKTVTVTVKNTTILSDMVWLQVDTDDFKRENAWVDVWIEEQNNPFLPTTEGVTREVTLTAWADPMKQELPITGTIRISLEGGMMYGWPLEDKPSADLTATVMCFEPLWIPMSFEDARPKLSDGSPMTMIKPWWTSTIEEGQPFYLITGWKIPVKNIGWDADTGLPVVPYESIEGGTGSPTMTYDVLTMNEEPVGEPTYSFEAEGRWAHIWNDPDTDPDVEFPYGSWAVVPLVEGVEHYYVFPEGLTAGEYDFYVHAIFSPGFGEWSATGQLIVEATTP